ncbi:MAG: hypothetical protein ACKO96_24680 [Flammeovirgaceae bacterium]
MEEGIQSDFKFIAGIIKATDELRMKRMIFRLSRARAIPTYFDYPHSEDVKPTVLNKLNLGPEEDFYNFLPRWCRRSIT